MITGCEGCALTWREVRAGGGGISGGPGTATGEEGRGGKAATAREGVVGVIVLDPASLLPPAAARPAQSTCDLLQHQANKPTVRSRAPCVSLSLSGLTLATCCGSACTARATSVTIVAAKP